MTTLFDQHARDTIAHALDRTLFVEAGAGTGKTTALVARVCTLIGSGVELRSLAAITFTEAAAAELRERVRDALEALARGDDPTRSAGEPGEVTPDARARATTALAQFDDAVITTLHGFAQRILAENPVEAGLPPGFEVLDAVQAATEFSRQFATLVDRLYSDPAFVRALLVLDALGFRLDRLEAVARALHADWDRLVGSDTGAVGHRPIEPFDPRACLAALDDAIAELPNCRVDDDRLALHLVGLAEFRDRLRGATDEYEALEVVRDLNSRTAGATPHPKFDTNHGQKPNWPDGGKDRVRAALVQAEDALADALEATRGPAFEQVLAATVEHVRASVDERRRQGGLEFHDLLVHARRLLRDDVTVRARLHERFQALLLDEFQDTDPLQIELAVLIATDDPDAGTKPWDTCTIPPGRLFVVGDPKQSIYRFRRADIGLYHDVRDRFPVDDRLVLSANFRSRPGVVQFVNEVFGALLPATGTATADAPTRRLQAAYEPLVASRPPGLHAGVPVTILGRVATADEDLAFLRREEARDLATLVQRIRDEGWKVAGSDGVDRPARYADIAFLLPTRTTLSYLEQALDEARIPARIESQSLVFATAEVEDLLSILTAIDDPTDEIAVVAALRSPGFACRDDKLADYVRGGGRWDYRAPAPPSLRPDHPVVASLAALRVLHDGRWWESVSETVERVIRERHLLELAATRARPRDHWRRLRFVADTARAFVDGGGASLRAFTRWLRDQIDAEARAVEVVVPEPDDDAVRILTVHGAKGLEFPIVILAGLGVAYQRRPGPVLWDVAARPEVRIASGGTRFETAGYAALHQLEGDADEAEQLRLMYVAATRARDHLVVSIAHRDGSRERSHARTLLDPILPVEHLWRRLPDLSTAAGPRAESPTPASPVPLAADPLVDDPLVDDPAGARAEWIAHRAAAVHALRRVPTAAATTLARRVASETTTIDDANLAKPDDDEPRGSSRGRAGSAIGRAVHAVLQSVDFDHPEPLAAIARAQAASEGVPERADEIRRLAASALRAPVLEAARQAGWPRWREVPVAHDVEGVLVEGFVDLLLDTPDGLVVVDYKTDRVPGPDELDAAVGRYSVQGAAYALVLEAALGRPVHRVVFVFARDGDPVERDVADLAGVTARVRAQLRGT